MTLRRIFLSAAIVIAAALPSARIWAADIDIKRLAPMDAHTFVYAKENEERAYQGEYLADAWKTFQDERICERVFDIVASRAPEEDMAKVKDVWSEIETALEPINLQAARRRRRVRDVQRHDRPVRPYGRRGAADRKGRRGLSQGHRESVRGD